MTQVVNTLRARKLAVPTVMTLLMLAALVVLGMWQLQRMAWKEALLARLVQNPRAAVLDVADGRALSLDQEFRTVQITCAAASRVRIFQQVTEINGQRAVSYLQCVLPGGALIAARLRPSQVPAAGNTNAIPVTGILRIWETPSWQQKLAGSLAVSRASFAEPRLSPFYVDAAGELPDAADIANNHFAYAIQWFAFAGVLGVIYALYARRVWQGRGSSGVK